MQLDAYCDGALYAALKETNAYTMDMLHLQSATLYAIKIGQLF